MKTFLKRRYFALFVAVLAFLVPAALMQSAQAVPSASSYSQSSLSVSYQGVPRGFGDGGTICKSFSLGQLCATVRQFKQGGDHYPWVDFYPSTSAPDKSSMSVKVQLCRQASNGACIVPSNAGPQIWNILSDYNNECTHIARGGPSDSGACDMSGASYDGTKGSYYFTYVTLTWDNINVVSVYSPVQLDR